MKIFISWSGETSKAVAIELRRWLKDVIQDLDLWMSDVDIHAGARWSAEIAENLEESKFGIICITGNNVEAPWILFEAGALAKSLKDTFVCPYLFGISKPDIPGGPLTQFQSKCANKKETLELLTSINNAIGIKKLDQEQLHRTFERCWPELEEKLEYISKVTPEVIEKRPTDEMVIEILNLVRGISGNSLASEEKLLTLLKRSRHARMDSLDQEWMLITQTVNDLFQISEGIRDVLMRCYDTLERKFHNEELRVNGSIITAFAVALIDELRADQLNSISESGPTESTVK